MPYMIPESIKKLRVFLLLDIIGYCFITIFIIAGKSGYESEKRSSVNTFIMVIN